MRLNFGQNLLQNYPYAINVRVRFGFWQNAHVRATCVRPKIECANVRACEAKNRRNSQIAKFYESRLNLFQLLLQNLFELIVSKLEQQSLTDGANLGLSFGSFNSSRLSVDSK